MEIIIWLIIGFVIGGGVGALLTWWISRARGGAVSVMQLKQENEKFRNEVTEHFVETARLINQMTDSYKQVFDHLSSGAEKLVDDKQLAERLPPSTGEEVRLSGFGAGGASSPSSSTAANSSTGARASKAAGASAVSGESAARDDAPGRAAGQSTARPAAQKAARSEASRPDRASASSRHASTNQQSSAKPPSSGSPSGRTGGASANGDPLKSPLQRKAEQTRWQTPSRGAAQQSTKTQGGLEPGGSGSGGPDRSESKRSDSRPPESKPSESKPPESKSRDPEPSGTQEKSRSSD